MAFNDFTSDRLRAVRAAKGQLHAELALLGEHVEAGRVRHVRRTWMSRDEDGNPVGFKSAPVNDTNADGELVPALLTVALVELVDLIADEAHGRWRIMSATAAKACGYKSVQGAKTAWLARHPRSPLCQLVWFALGDHRDPNRWLTNTRMMRWFDGKSGKRVGDYTSDPRLINSGDAPVMRVSPEVEAAMALRNRQKDVRRTLDTAKAMAGESEAERLARITVAADEMRVNIRRELHIITDRLDRAERTQSAA